MYSCCCQPNEEIQNHKPANVSQEANADPVHGNNAMTATKGIRCYHWEHRKRATEGHWTPAELVASDLSSTGIDSSSSASSAAGAARSNSCTTGPTHSNGTARSRTGSEPEMSMHIRVFVNMPTQTYALSFTGMGLSSACLLGVRLDIFLYTRLHTYRRAGMSKRPGSMRRSKVGNL